MSTIETTVPVPQVSQLVAIEDEIRDARARQAAILANIVEDCEFMDVPLLTLGGYLIDGDDALTPGDVAHVVFIEDESSGRDSHRFHRAATCSNWMCDLSGRTKYPKYAHVGSRYWATPIEDHVVVGVERYVDENMFGRHPRWRYTLVPLSQRRA